MTEFKEINCGEFYAKVLSYEDGSLAVQIPAFGDWITLSGNHDMLAELAHRLLVTLKKIEEDEDLNPNSLI